MPKDSKKLLYDALSSLSSFQKKDGGRAIFCGMSALGEEYTRILLDAGFLIPVLKGWYMASKPGLEGDSTVWYALFWEFVSSYMSSKFGDNWSLTPETSLFLHSGGTTVPNQLIVRSPIGMNNIQELPFGCSVLDIRASVSDDRVVNSETGCWIYPVEEALLLVAPDYYSKRPMEAAVCLSRINDESRVVSFALRHKSILRCSKLCGALSFIGKVELSARIVESMKKMGYRSFRSENPFFQEFIVSIPRTFSPQAARLSVLWSKLKSDLLFSDVLSGIEPSIIEEKEILKSMDENYVLDSYHSLSIEGYVVTESLLEKVRSGKWNPSKDGEDQEQRNALAARGYFLAYESVKDSVRKVLHGGSAGEVYVSEHREWHYRLFEPAVVVGLLEAKDLVGYRNHPVYIRGSRHVPVNFEVVPECMEVLSGLFREESSPLIRAILGHFFFTYIHPYMDGNGRTARFAMNLQLVTAGYDWIVIPKEMRSEYMSALEKAAVDEDIVPFGRFISYLLKNPIKKTRTVNNQDKKMLELLGVSADYIEELVDKGELIINTNSLGKNCSMELSSFSDEIKFYIKEGDVMIRTNGCEKDFTLKDAWFGSGLEVLNFSQDNQDSCIDILSNRIKR